MGVGVQERETEVASELRRLQKTPREVAFFLANAPVFDYERWCREAPPASAEELAEMEDLLEEREAERLQSLEREGAESER